MQHAITANISRLSLHDSTFEYIHREGADIVLVADWAKLSDFEEQHINESIILGRTVLSFKNVTAEKPYAYAPLPDGDDYGIIDFPDSLIQLWGPIGDTRVSDEANSFSINGMFTDRERRVFVNGAEDAYWLEWSFHFESCKISWDSFVTRTEWLNGKIPD